MSTGALDKLGNSLPPKATKRSPYFDATCAPRRFGAPLHWLPLVERTVICACDGHCIPQSHSIANDSNSAVLRGIQPFMAIGGPRVCKCQAVDQMLVAGG